MIAAGGYDPGLGALLAEAAIRYRAHDDGAVLELLGEAVRRVPHRFDIRLNLANYHIQLNAPERALEIFGEAVEMRPMDTESRIYLAHWLRYADRAGQAEDIRRALAVIQPCKAADLGKIWRHIDGWLGKPIGDALPRPPSRRVAVTVLGYVLNDDGGMHPVLERRLEKALAAAAAYPEADIVVSGGVPKAGRVEAEVMRDWLIGRGVAAGRIHLEGYSRDIVENLIYSRNILDLLDPDLVVLITSAHNVRRAGAGLEILCWNNGSNWQVESIAPSVEGYLDDGRDRLKVYRDTLRAYGMPMMNSFPELVER